MMHHTISHRASATLAPLSFRTLHRPRPTLVSANGNAVIQIGDVDGVRVAGPILLQAGGKPTDALLQWGTRPGGYSGKPSSPGVIADVFARVGGPGTAPVQADVMFRINNGNVIIDNTWLWRADHTEAGPTRNSANPCAHGLQVFGDDVTAYGLAVEHTLKDLVQWGGNGGQTYARPCLHTCLHARKKHASKQTSRPPTCDPHAVLPAHMHRITQTDRRVHIYTRLAHSHTGTCAHTHICLRTRTR